MRQAWHAASVSGSMAYPGFALGAFLGGLDRGSDFIVHSFAVRLYTGARLAAAGDGLAQLHDAFIAVGTGETYPAAPPRARQGAHGRGRHELPAFRAALDPGGVFSHQW